MGWTSYQATHYKNGKIDRKAECDRLFNWADDSREVAVLKSAMVGSTYYAAVKATKGDFSEVHAVVCLTSTNSRDYFNFSYKDMDETCGPFQYNCPKGILDLLSPTDNEYALAWREACRENLAKKKSATLNKLPVGTQIRVVMPFNTNHFKEGQIVILEKQVKPWSNRTMWTTKVFPICRFTSGLMKALEGHYEIIKQEV